MTYSLRVVVFAALLLVGSAAGAANGVSRGDRVGKLSDQITTSGAAILGQCNLLAYEPKFWTGATVEVPNAVFTPGTTGSTVYTGVQAQNIIMQDFLLYCQRESIKIGAQHFASLHIPSNLRAVVTGAPFGFKTRSPFVIPRYVDLDSTAMSWERDGTGAGTSLNWNGSPISEQLGVRQFPMLLFSAAGGGTAPGSNLVINAQSNGSDNGSGWASDNLYEVGGLTIQAAGAGIPGASTTCRLINGDTIPPATQASFGINVSGGAATSITTSFSRYGRNGVMTLPAWARRRQYTIANGWGAPGADSRHPQVFADELNFYYKTTCNNGSGTYLDYGLTVQVKDQPSYCKTGITADSDSVSCTTRTDGPGGSNTPYWAFALGTSATSLINNIVVAQSGQLAMDADFGWIFSGWTSAFESTAHQVQSHNSSIGHVMDGVDYVLELLNDVGSGISSYMHGGGSEHVLFDRADTPHDPITSDPYFIKMERCNICGYYDGVGFFNSNSTTAHGSMIRVGLGAESDSTHQIAGSVVRKFLASDATGGSAVTGVEAKNTNTTLFDINISNTATNGSARPTLFTKLFNFSTPGGGDAAFSTSNVILGSIDRVAGSIFTGTVPYAGIKAWDAYAQGWAGPGEIYSIYGATTPVDGTTGANKAVPSSMAFSAADKAIFVNEGTQASPVWNKVLTTRPVVPTIGSGFGTSPSVTAGSTANAFRVNVGTGGAATTGVVTLGAAAAGWNCFATDITTTDSFVTAQTASSTTTASFKNYSRTTGLATAWTASDILAISCQPY